MTLVAVVFNGVWISNGFVELVFSDRELLLKMFALLFIILGVGSTYCAIAGWLNSTWISVNDSEIVVEIGPIPWLGNKRVTTNNIGGQYVL